MTTLDVIQIIRDEGIVTETAKLQAIAKALDAAAREAKEERKHNPRGKTRLLALLRSADPVVARAVEAGVFIISVPDDESTATYSGESLIARLRSAVVAHNEAPKKRRGKARSKIETWQQAFTQLRAKTIKESGSTIGIKQKGNPAECVLLLTEGVAP
jgi:hypothetical protein